jgi:hypothetical protein
MFFSKIESSLFSFSYARWLFNMKQKVNVLESLEIALLHLEAAIKSVREETQKPKPLTDATFLRSDLPPPGTVYHDSCIFIGISPTMNRPLFVMPHDLPGWVDWSYAKMAAAQIHFGGYDDWRLPTSDELRLLFLNKAVIPRLLETWYWTGNEVRKNSAVTRFLKNGETSDFDKTYRVRTRYVRTV